MIDVNPLDVAIIRHRLMSIAREMGAVVLRTAQTQIINECHDFSTAIFDAKGRLMSQVEDLPIHVAGNFFMARAIIESYAPEDIYPEDVFLVSDPYTMHAGAHLPDWTMLRPIFYKGNLTFWAMCRAHMMDPGGIMPFGFDPSAYDIYAEALIIPPLKLYEKGELNRELYKLLLRNSRFPKNLRVDTMAMHGSLKLCEKRIGELMDKYGVEKLTACLEYAIKSTENAVREEIKKMPDGIYQGHVIADNDGFTEEPINLWCKITIKDDKMVIDFTGSDKQRRFVNSPLANTYAATFIAIFSSIDPHIIHNEGSYRPVEIIAPEGTVVNPSPPATVGCCTISLATPITEVVMDALAKAIPEKVSAGWCREFSLVITGRNPETGEIYAGVDFCTNGGSGAIWGYDGWPHIGPVNGGGALIKPPVEMAEIIQPWLITEYTLLEDSAGAGKYRGGLGVRHQVVNQGIESLLILVGDDHSKSPPFGHSGGKSGKRSKIIVKRGEEELIVPTKKWFPLLPGDIIVTEATGGGGVGDPLERSIDLVREDVINGYISGESAKKDYGIVIDPKTFEVDLEGSKKLKFQEALGRHF